MTKIETPCYFSVFDDKFIVTACEDGRIPIASKIVVDLPRGGVQNELMEVMLHQANMQPKLLNLLKMVVENIDYEKGCDDQEVANDLLRQTRDIIAKAEGVQS